MRENRNIFNIIDSLSVSKGWKDVFKKIQVSYYHNFYQGKANNIHNWRYCQMVMNPSSKDRFKFFTRFNFFALVFGPLYYLAKFIFPKALILLLIEGSLIYYATTAYNHTAGYICILIHIYTAIFANTDYFSKKVLGHPFVKENPDVLSDYIDDSYLKNLSRRESLYAPFAGFVTLLVVIIGLFLYFDITKGIECKKALNQTAKVCTTKQKCYDTIKVASMDIKNGKEPLYKQYFKLGCAYYELGDKHRAIDALNRTISLKKDFQPPYLLRGIIFAEFKQYSKARDSYESAIKIYPEGKIFYLLGSAYYKEGRYKEAKNNFEKATKAYPKEVSYWEALAYANIYLKDATAAKEALQKAVRVLKNDGETKNAARIERIEGYMRGIR